jgi:alkaline phosphatase D
MRSPIAPAVALATILLLAHCTNSDGEPTPAPTTPSSRSLNKNVLPARIAFGSCAQQDKPQPILRTAVRTNPDLFLYLGDAIYGDTGDMVVLQKKYDQLAKKSEFQLLRTSVPLLAVWDDHDYGSNDAGKEYPFKAESKRIFLDFWSVPPASPRRMHDGIYGVERFTAKGKTLQLILLDMRWFRDALKRSNSETKDYDPDTDPSKSFLGEQQWQWLDAELRTPADIRVIASSTQFAHEYNGYESWNNLPLEQARMIRTIRSAQAKGIVFLSGDAHWGEISVRKFDDGYAMMDATSSGITEQWPQIPPNAYRRGEAVPENNFGVLEIDWNATAPIVSVALLDVNGSVRAKHQAALSELQ